MGGGSSIRAGGRSSDQQPATGGDDDEHEDVHEERGGWAVLPAPCSLPRAGGGILYLAPRTLLLDGRAG